MSKAKPKREPEAVEPEPIAVESTVAVESTASPPEPTQATPPVPAPSHGWYFDAMASGVEKLLATMLFRRVPSAVPAPVGFARREEMLAQLEEFKAKHPAPRRLAELSDRLTKAQNELDAAVEKHAAAQEAFVDDPSKAEELEAVYATIVRQSAQCKALGPAVETARTNALTAYQVWQKKYDAERQERLKANCAAVAEKVEGAVAPLLNEFGAARDLLRHTPGLLWPDFGSVFPSAPEPKADDKPSPKFNLTVGGNVPVLADNRFHLPPVHRAPDPNWGRRTSPPIIPVMQPLEQPTEEEATNGNLQG